LNLSRDLLTLRFQLLAKLVLTFSQIPNLSVYACQMLVLTLLLVLHLRDFTLQSRMTLTQLVNMVVGLHEVVFDSLMVLLKRLLFLG
jgi:hypothetical protein